MANVGVCCFDLLVFLPDLCPAVMENSFSFLCLLDSRLSLFGHIIIVLSQVACQAFL